MTISDRLLATISESAEKLLAIAAEVASMEGAQTPVEPEPVEPPPVDPPPAVDPDPVEPPPVVLPPVDPPPQPESGTLLRDVAATMAPGEWRRVATKLIPGADKFKSMQYVSAIPPATGGADGMGWSERLVEHDGELMLMLMRDVFQKYFLRMDSSGQWHRTPMGPETGWGLRNERRPFNRLFKDGDYLYFAPADRDVEIGYTLRTPLDEPGMFERYGIPVGDGAFDTVGNFSMTLAEEWGRFYCYYPGGKLVSWAEGETSWREHYLHLPKADRNTGYGGSVTWNPIKKEIITIGGQSFGSTPDLSYRVMKLTEPDGKAELFDAVFEDGTVVRAINAGASQFLHHPVTGEWLMIYRNGPAPREGIMYRSDDARVWREYQNLRELKPWGAWELYMPWTTLSGTPDVLVMVSHIEGVWLHRMKDDGGAPPVLPPPVDPDPVPPVDPEPTDPDPVEPPPVDPVPPVEPDPVEPVPTDPEPSPVGEPGLIAKTLEGMQPGDYRLVLADDGSTFKVRGVSGTYWIIDWTPRMHWDASSQQIILFGLRQQHKAIAYSEATGKWRDLPLPDAWVSPDGPTAFNGHWYGWSASDDSGGIYAKNYRFDIATETYRQLPDIPIRTNGSNGSMLAWMGNRLARYGGDAQRFMVYDPATDSWPIVVSLLGQGQHALAEYHPDHDKVLIIGGNPLPEPDGTLTILRSTLVNPDGTYQRVANLPERVSMSEGSWIIPHISGAWVIRTKPKAGEGIAKIYAYWPERDAWEYVCDAPDADQLYTTAAYDKDRDIVLIVHHKGLSVWKPPVIV